MFNPNDNPCRAITLFSPTMKTASFNLELLTRKRDKRLSQFLEGYDKYKGEKTEAIQDHKQVEEKWVEGSSTLTTFLSAGDMTLMCSLS